MASTYVAYINVTPDHPGDCQDVISKQKEIIFDFVRDKGGSIISTIIEPPTKSFVLVKLPYAIALCQIRGADLLIASCDILGREYDVAYKMLKYFIGITSCDPDGGCNICCLYQ